MENRFAAARRRYLRTHMDGIYTGMLLTGTLEPHLEEIGESAQAMFDRMGNIFNPRNLSSNFSKLLEMKGLRHIRFHDLRHSCASLLLANDVPMKQIQEWLGHSDISTTMNIYAHLDTTAKDVSAAAMSQALSLPEYNGGYGWQRN